MAGLNAPVAPGYWMNETSGVLRPVVLAYLAGDDLTEEQVGTMRAYLRHWIAADWHGPTINTLREMIGGIATRDDIAHWLDLALDANIDPL